jgi:hypothetical protein
MIVNIDPEGLRKEREELKLRLATIEALLTLIQPTTQVVPAIAPAPNNNRQYRQGLQRDLLLALSTGPAKVEELSKVLPEWKYSQISSAVRTLLDGRMAFVSEHGAITLSQTGKERAKWFGQNPNKKVYRA